MKYLKSLNESFSTLKKVKDLCEEHLIDLIDDGGYIVLVEQKNVNLFKFELRARPIATFSYYDIKDKFISFLDFINSEYNISDVKLYEPNQINHPKIYPIKINDIKLDNILNDNIDDLKILAITLNIEL